MCQKESMSILKKYIDKLQSRKYLQKDRNSITVDDVTIDFPLVFEGNGKMYFFKLDRYVYVKGTRYTKADGKTRDFLLICLFKKGFMSDGASAPHGEPVRSPVWRSVRDRVPERGVRARRASDERPAPRGFR